MFVILELLIFCVFVVFIWAYFKDQNDGYQKMDVSQMNSNQRRKFITNYSLNNCKHGNQGYERVLLQIFGLPGNGKSSFINSCKFVIDEVYNEHAKAADGETDSHGGFTTRRISYKLTDVITLVDNRGCPKLGRYETGEVFAQLGNLVPLDEEVTWDRDHKTNMDRLLDENKNPNYSDFIVPIFIHSVRNRIPQQQTADFKELLTKAREVTGIKPIIVLTFKSHGGVMAMCATFRDMGFDKIYRIENYTVKDNQKVFEKHEEIQELLCHVLKNVDFCMKTKRDRTCERMDRMKCVLKYLKEAEEKEERERREYLETRLKEESEKPFFRRLFSKT